MDRFPADPSDHTPRQEFVLGSNKVHENQYGKGLWAKIPAEGHTTVSRPFLAGQDENGRNIWKREMRTVTNRELKEMVEFYKTRGRDEKSAAQKGEARQEKDGRGGRKTAQKAETEPDSPGDKAPAEKASVKEQLASGKKEAGITNGARKNTPKKQHIGFIVLTKKKKTETKKPDPDADYEEDYGDEIDIPMDDDEDFD